MHLEISGMNIEKTNHAGFRIEAGKAIYIDPFRLPSTEKKADIVFITHEHFDHMSPEDLKKIVTPETKIVSMHMCRSALQALNPKELHIMKPGESMEIDGISVEAVHAYNIDKPFHPKADGKLGFVLKIKKKMPETK